MFQAAADLRRRRRRPLPRALALASMAPLGGDEAFPRLHTLVGRHEYFPADGAPDEAGCGSTLPIEWRLY